MPSISQFLTFLLRWSPYTFLPVHRKECLWPSIWYGQSQPHHVYFVMKWPKLPPISFCGNTQDKTIWKEELQMQLLHPQRRARAWSQLLRTGRRYQSYLNRLLMLYNLAFETSLTKIHGQDNSLCLQA